MPRFDIRYRDEEIRKLLQKNADGLTAQIAAIMSTEDRTGRVQAGYVKLELTHAPDDINTCAVNVNVDARALPGRVGRERELARSLRDVFVTATEGRFPVGVWLTLSAHSTYREYQPE